MASLAAPATAHQVKTSGDVGGTIHVEPNDNPRAGEPSVAWFALTRQGGQPIPLDECDCTLAIYAQPYQDGEDPVLEPSLKPISAEGYEGIPGTELTFPQVGAYDVVLRGQPLDEAGFQPFELRFDITVATGTAAKPSPDAIAQSPVAPVPGSEAAQPANPADDAPAIAAEPAAPTDVAPEPAEEETQSGFLWILGAIAVLLVVGGILALVRQGKLNRRL